MTGLPDPATRPLLTVAEVLDGLDGVMGRSALYEALGRGEVPGARRVGRRLLVCNRELREWLRLDPPSSTGAVATRVTQRHDVV